MPSSSLWLLVANIDAAATALGQANLYAFCENKVSMIYLNRGCGESATLDEQVALQCSIRKRSKYQYGTEKWDA